MRRIRSSSWACASCKGCSRQQQNAGSEPQRKSRSGRPIREAHRRDFALSGETVGRAAVAPWPPPQAATRDGCSLLRHFDVALRQAGEATSGASTGDGEADQEAEEAASEGHGQGLHVALVQPLRL